MNKNYTMEEYVLLIEEALKKAITPCDFGYDVVHKAMEYSLTVGGKRIRPILVLEFCRVCGGDVEKALPLACAIEMIHTYSLIHDDLPAMDNDDMRRGMPSCHKKFGENYAILAGDALLTRAFGLISESEFALENPSLALKAVQALSFFAGSNGMIGGQVVDLSNENKSANLETLKIMDSLKTGALIKCACVLGCICAGASEEEIENAGIYAEKIGQAFQIVDDILDVTGTEEELGKPIGSDKDKGKSTYYSLLGGKKAQAWADKLTDEAIKALDIFGENGIFLEELALKLAKRKS